MSELARRTTEKIKRLGEKLGLKAARGAGSLALSSSVETNGPISRREALKNRAGEHKRIISRAYKDYVTEAASRGMDESAIRQSLPDAWNSGALPRAIQGDTLREPGGGHEMLIFRGQLPPDFADRLDMQVLMPSVINELVPRAPGEELIVVPTLSEGTVLAGQYRSDQLPSEPGRNGFRVETVGFGPGQSDRQLRKGVERVEAAIAPYLQAQAQQAGGQPPQPRNLPQ